jgi:glycosyltransferase involved in cell wall biosynthesis
LKILQINSVANSGSTGRIAEEIGKVLLKQGHESYIAYGRNHQPSQSQLIKIGNQNDIYLHGVQTLLFDKHGLASKKATKNFLKVIDEIQPDIIAIHNLHGYYINYPLLFNYIKERNIPVTWTFHDCWPFTGHCSYFERVSCEKWKTHCHKCPLSDAYPKSFKDRSFQNFIDKQSAFLGVDQLKIITPSLWLVDLVKQSFLKPYPVEVVHNGVDLNRFKPLAIDKKNKRNIILGVASTWDPRKGLLDFIELRKLLSPAYKIVLIGLSQKQIDALPEGILGIRRTENVEALVEWYNKANFFVNPTYVDNFPTTNIEALACGTPVITYNTGGSPEAIDTETGEVVDKGDVAGIAEAIKNLGLKDQYELSRKCVDRAKLLYDKEHRYLDYLKIFENMIK